MKFTCIAVGLSIVACKSAPSMPEHESDASLPANGDASAEIPDAELLKPEACASCHPAQFTEWQGSMHAYAAKDPVFRAMNARGQEETDGKLGTFCVSCHAPVAVAYGLTTDGLNLEQLPSEYQGITCYFCHNVESVAGDHNNPLNLAKDGLMRGPFADPVATSAHRSGFSSYLDRQDPNSSRLCGACHDVVIDAHALGSSPTRLDVPLEQTYQEWQRTLFNQSSATGGLNCNGCHMPISTSRETSADPSAVGAELPRRQSRRHDFEGVDQALVEFPGVERQRKLVEQFLDSSLLGEVCVSRDGVLGITIENTAGHHWPSGATFDRLAWLDVRAYDSNGLVFATIEPEAGFRVSSERDAGQSLDGSPLDASNVSDAAQGFDASPGSGELPSASAMYTVAAPTLTSTVSKLNGEPAHFFWEVAKVDSDSSLPGVVTRDPLSPDFHVERRVWQLDTRQLGFDSLVEVHLTVRLRPIKDAVMSELVASGHLSADVARQMPTLAVLPQRCHSARDAAQFPDILVGVQTDCDPNEPLHSTTLLWKREQAVEGNRNFRQVVLQGAPALCLSHPTYIPPEPN